LDGQVSNGYTVIVNNVKDYNGNVISTDSSATGTIVGLTGLGMTGVDLIRRHQS